LKQILKRLGEKETSMKIYQLDPTKDSRWAELVKRHPRASVFHTVAWLRALRLTYGYEPVAFTTSPPTSELTNGLVFCNINSWLTGRRLVSLPFSDHCEFLCDSPEDLNFLIRYLQTASDHQQWKYVEVRPINWYLGQRGEGIDWPPAATYYLHTLDLRPNLDEVFRSLDKDSVQRRVQRAHRAGLVERSGNRDDLLKQFYRLLVMTRGRHQVPPPPYAWFRNLVHCQGEALEIRLAYQSETPVSGILTLRFRDIVYYKYGCSDGRFKRFGAMPWLLWNAIASAKSEGETLFDMGRTEQNNEGLLVFKNHWTPHPTELVYLRFPQSSHPLDVADGWKMSIAKRAFSHMPTGLLKISGKLLYRHIG
jgi:Acetyltransferase (GNAT) domain